MSIFMDRVSTFDYGRPAELANECRIACRKLEEVEVQFESFEDRKSKQNMCVQRVCILGEVS